MKPIHIVANPTPFHYEESHMAEVRFYKLFTKRERIVVAKSQGVKILKDT